MDVLLLAVWTAVFGLISGTVVARALNNAPASFIFGTLAGSVVAVLMIDAVACFLQVPTLPLNLVAAIGATSGLIGASIGADRPSV